MANKSFLFDTEDFEKIKEYYWSVDAAGYVNTSKNHKKIKLHRFIMNCEQDMVVDHINHQKNENRKSNLRIATIVENVRNSKISKRNTSGVTGVRWHKRYNKWIANIVVYGKTIHLGYYDVFEEAVKARKKAEEKYFGDFSYDKSMAKGEGTNGFYYV
jgi:hypothetical protein